VARDLTLRRIHPGAVPAALERARVYRLLNEPQQAESICLDILAIEPRHQEALTTLIMAFTDQFPSRAGLVDRAKARVAELAGEYERLYFLGLVHEREARAHLTKGPSASFAHDLFLEAIACYERAETLRPPNNDDPILRRNGCLRTMAAEGLEPMAETEEQLLE
jgi:hypothetical protein